MSQQPLPIVQPSSISLSGEWRFAIDPTGAGQSQGWTEADFDDAVWSAVTVPHTWNVMPDHLDYEGVAWYRRSFTLPAEVQDAHLRLRFAAVFYLARVWLNGEYLGEHEGGYTPSEFDVGELIKRGEHGLAETVTIMTADYDDLKKLNTVFSRPVHYPQSEFILDYADRHGILLIPEVPAWQLTAAQMADPDMVALAQQQLREMIAANFNHPSVWAWSVGNEFDSETRAGHDYVREMIALARSLDSTRPVGFASNRLNRRPQDDATDLADFVMMNQYFGTWAGPKGGLGPALDWIHQTWPEKPVIISEYGFEPHWNALGGPATESLDSSQYYFIAEDTPSGAEVADEQRRQLIAEQMAVFRDRPAVTLSALSAGEQTATVALRTRGPVAVDMPAYTLWEYRLRWAVLSPNGDNTYVEGDLPLPALAPGTRWTGEIKWPVPEAEYILHLRIIRPTGFEVIDRWYNSQGNLLPDALSTDQKAQMPVLSAGEEPVLSAGEGTQSYQREKSVKSVKSVVFSGESGLSC